MTGEPDLYQRFVKRSGRAVDADFEAEIIRRADGKSVALTRDYFFHMNPLYEPAKALRYVTGRYEALYDYLDREPARSILEIGCAQGLSTWLAWKPGVEVVGLDISEARDAVGRMLFPEVEFVAEDWRSWLERTGRRFDLIICSHGPFHWDDALPRFCDRYVNIGYRTREWATAVSGAHKIAGRQLSFSTTAWDGASAGKAPGYNRYFLRRNWLKEARHALTSGYALPT